MDRYTAPDIQNEILKIMTLLILRGVVDMISIAPFLIDETTDVSNKEQVVICFWWVDQSLETHKDFIGLYQAESTESEMLIAVIHYVLHRLNISVSKLRGHAVMELQQCLDHREEWLLGFSGKSLGLCTHTAMAMP